MRLKILLTLFALVVAGAANHACAQRRGGASFGFAHSGFGHARPASPRRFNHAAYGFGRNYQPYGYGYGYAYLPYGGGYGDDADDSYSLQPALYVPQPPALVQPPPPPAPRPPGHAVITEYHWPAVAASSSLSGSEPQSFAIVLKNGSTLSAAAVFASGGILHYVDLDQRHLGVSMTQVDRTATLKLNQARNLSLYLPAAQ